MIDYDEVVSFKRYQFDDPRNCYIGSGWLMNENSVKLLDKLSITTGWPVIPHFSVGGCVVMDDGIDDIRFCNSEYHTRSKGYSAIDFHFATDAHPKDQIHKVLISGFTGIGVFYNIAIHDRDSEGIRILQVAFHVDLRPVEETQIWTCGNKGENKYLFEK